MEIKTFKPGGFFGIAKLMIDDKFLKLWGAYGYFTVPTKSIETVTVDAAGFGTSVMKIIGKGTELAVSKKMPVDWAEKGMQWILDNLEQAKNG